MTSNGYRFLGVFLLGAIVGPFCLFAYNSHYNTRILVPAGSQAEFGYANVITVARKAAGEVYRMRIQAIDGVTGVALPSHQVDAVKGGEASASIVHKNMNRLQTVKLLAPKDWDKEPATLKITWIDQK